MYSSKRHFVETRFEIIIIFSSAISLKPREQQQDIRYVLHALQLEPETAFVKNELGVHVTVKEKSEKYEYTFKVKVWKRSIFFCFVLEIFPVRI